MRSTLICPPGFAPSAAIRDVLIRFVNSREGCSWRGPTRTLRRPRTRVPCGLVLDVGRASGPAVLIAVLFEQSHLLAPLEQMPFQVPCALASHPEPDVEMVIVADVNLPDGQVPVLVGVVNELLGGLRAVLVREHLLDFRPAREERLFCAFKRVAYLDDEREDAGRERAALLQIVTVAALKVGRRSWC